MDKLYKFRNVDTNSLSSLASSTLWFSSLEDFNDPFEGTLLRDNDLSDDDCLLWMKHCWGILKLNREEETFVKACLQLNLDPKTIDEKEFIYSGLSTDLDLLIGIVHKSKFLSLSLKDDSSDPIYENLMWSHYANGLRGFCLVFDSQKLQQDIYEECEGKMRPIKVIYSDTPKKLSLSEFVRSEQWVNINDINYIQRVIDSAATKSPDWLYENEFRISILNQKKSNYKYSVGSLEQVIIGEKMSDAHKELILSIISTKYPNASIKIAKRKLASYSLEVVDYIA